MEHISELTESLNGYFGWNKARMTCFVKMLLALASDAQQSSRYRQLPRLIRSKLKAWQTSSKFISIRLSYRRRRNVLGIFVKVCR